MISSTSCNMATWSSAALRLPLSPASSSSSFDLVLKCSCNFALFFSAVLRLSFSPAKWNVKPAFLRLIAMFVCRSFKYLFRNFSAAVSSAALASSGHLPAGFSVEGSVSNGAHGLSSSGSSPWLSPVKSIRGHWVWSSTAGMASWRNCSDEVDSGLASESSNSWAAASRLATMDSRLGKSKTWAAGQTPSVSASPSEPLEESLWFPASGLWATRFLFFGLR